jgi:SAM-dependent methyltransferase
MSVVFGRDYADVYDAIYRSKDYEGEADLIERLLARHGASRPCRVLDIGCGTGRHAFALAQRGYEVTGIDRSPFMLAHARTALSAEQNKGHKVPRFVAADARQFQLDERFAVALMMFTVLGYQHVDAELSSALASVRAHLEPDGLFLFDVWNGLAVHAQGPDRRTVTANEGASRVIRSSATRVDPDKRLCHVHFEIIRTGGDEEAKSWSEDHTLRYFVPSELASMLKAQHFELLDLLRFPEGDAPPDERAWNMIGVARAQ